MTQETTVVTLIQGIPFDKMFAISSGFYVDANRLAGGVKKPVPLKEKNAGTGKPSTLAATVIYGPLLPG